MRAGFSHWMPVLRPCVSLRMFTPFCACFARKECLPNVARPPVSLPLNPNRAVAPPQPLAAAKDQENAAKETKLGSDVTWEWQKEDGDWKAFTSGQFGKNQRYDPVKPKLPHALFQALNDIFDSLSNRELLDQCS